MRVTVLGGTRFIGRRIVDELLAHDHDVQVVHRGKAEPDGLPDVPHVHADRTALGDARAEIDAFAPDALVDCMAIGAADTEAVLAALGHVGRLVVLSSCDVYRAFGSVHAQTVSDPVPLTEESPVRENRYPYRGQIPGMDDYEKLDVEERYLAHGGTVLRLPMVFGEHDYQRREWFVLQRIAAGEKRMPFGTGNALFAHGYVGDIAAAARLVVEAGNPSVSAEIFNLAEQYTPTVRLRAQWIAEAAEAELEFDPVPDDELPPELGITAAVAQPIVIDSLKARRVLGWTEADPRESLRRSVEWHLDHPPLADPATA
ncbi:MAG: NAD-dependent epimerase/dehydratase family protein [Acidimicrobiia bacterium]